MNSCILNPSQTDNHLVTMGSAVLVRSCGQGAPMHAYRTVYSCQYSVSDWFSRKSGIFTCISGRTPRRKADNKSLFSIFPHDDKELQRWQRVPLTAPAISYGNTRPCKKSNQITGSPDQPMMKKERGRKVAMTLESLIVLRASTCWPIECFRGLTLRIDMTANNRRLVLDR